MLSSRALVLSALAALSLSPLFAGEKTDPAEVILGERLFLETRFARFFAEHSGGDANGALVSGDPAMNFAVTTGKPVAGAFAGQSMNCRACHAVDDYKPALGNRNYSDFARRSPLPARIDGLSRTLRNSPGLVDVTPPEGVTTLFHYDGEFTDLEELVAEGMTGRNYGWLPREHAEAVAHIAHIIRDDDGAGALAKENGGRYAAVFSGESTALEAKFKLPPEYRLDVKKATDEEIVRHIGKLVNAYMKSLAYARDDKGLHNGSPYDAFLELNGLPRAPGPRETPFAYSRRLIALIDALPEVRFVADASRTLKTHARPVPFEFGPEELAGLKIFFTTPGEGLLSLDRISGGGIGNCIACHAAPAFTDFKFHNTGVTQEEYDAKHGEGAFMNLSVPSLVSRDANPDHFLMPSPAHPDAEGPFAMIPSAKAPERVDLGLWNVFANPDLPGPRPVIRAMLAEPGKKESDAAILEKTIARFKTPSLRDSGQSAPYLHNGSKDSLAKVLAFYREVSPRARSERLRNADPELRGIALTAADLARLEAFLKSLDEDYE